MLAQLAQATSGQYGVLMLAQRFRHFLYRLSKTHGVLAENAGDRLTGISRLLGGLASVVQQPFALGAGQREGH